MGAIFILIGLIGLAIAFPWLILVYIILFGLSIK